jgi:paired small multidrug resistance pump
MNKGWFYIWIGGVIEVGWVAGMKAANHFIHWALIACGILTCFCLILLACKTLPAGTVYAVFTGIGTAGAVIAEMVFWGEPVRWSKIGLIGLLLVGVIGLKLVTNEEEKEENQKNKAGSV